jgi:DNA primase
MAEAASLSLKSVQAAVKAAVAEFPKFNVAMPEQVTVSYLIRGIPIYEPLATSATLGELQAFADAVAGHITTAQPELLDPKLKLTGKGAVLSFGGHVICGIPPVT